jgi:hypothetical protein
MELATYKFPTESINCEPGDYLVCEVQEGKPVIYWVEDLLLVKRLVRLSTESSDLVLEENLLDSVAPAYFNEVYLLLTELEPGVSSEKDVVKAIRTCQLTEKTRGILRNSRYFTKSNCQVIH